MKEVENLIRTLAESVAESMGFEILDMRLIPHHRRKNLRFVLDCIDRGITVTDCADFSRQLSQKLDMEDPIKESYSIEVSSPGFHRNIRIPKDLPRFVNHRVKVRLIETVHDRVVWIGVLKSESDPLEILTDEIGDIHISFDNIKQLNLHA